MCFNPSPERRVPSPNRYMALAKFCFCKNNKRTIIINNPPALIPTSLTGTSATCVCVCVCVCVCAALQPPATCVCVCVCVCVWPPYCFRVWFKKQTSHTEECFLFAVPERNQQMEGQLVSPEAQVGDGFGSSLSASSDCSPGILAIGGPLF
jgi:hypothetical protein